MRWKLVMLTSVLATAFGADHRSRYERINVVRTVPNGTTVRSDIVHATYGLRDVDSEAPSQKAESGKIYHVSPTTVVRNTEYVASSSVPSPQFVRSNDSPENFAQNHGEHGYVASPPHPQDKNVFRSRLLNKEVQQNRQGLGGPGVVSHQYLTSYKNCLTPQPPSTTNAALLPLLGILLEFLYHTSEFDKAYLVVSLLKTFLDSVPDSQEKYEFLQKLSFVEYYALQHERGPGGFEEFFNFNNNAKTNIVLSTDLPGFEEKACRVTFNNLLQTSLNVYQEVAKQPKCNPIGWQTLFISNNFVQPTEPVTFEVVFPKEPTYPPVPHEVFPKLPNNFLEKVKLILQHKTVLPNNNRFIPFYPPNPNQPINNIPFGPVNPPNYFPFPPVNPENNNPFVPLNPFNPPNPANNVPVGPLSPPNITPFNPNLPFNPSNIPPKDNPFAPLFPHNDLVPFNPSDYQFNPQNPNGPQAPTLTLDVLIKLLGIVATGQNDNNGQLNPFLQQYLMKLLYSLQNSPNADGSYVAGKNNPSFAALLQFILQKYANQNGLDNYPQFPSDTNAYKFDNNGFIELTYILKRPKPLIYQPVYYIKYRLPYQTFLQNFYDVITKKPELQFQPEKLYQELLAVSNVTQVSPNLNGYGKDDVLKLVFGNGALVDAKLVKPPTDNGLSEQLELIKNINSNVDAEQIGFEVFKWLNSTNPVTPVQNDFGGNVKYFEFSQNPYHSAQQTFGAVGTNANGISLSSSMVTGQAPKPAEKEPEDKPDDNSPNDDPKHSSFLQFSQSGPSLLGSSKDRAPFLSEASNSKGALYELSSNFKPLTSNGNQNKSSDDVPLVSSKAFREKEVSDLFAKLDQTKFKRKNV